MKHIVKTAVSLVLVLAVMLASTAVSVCVGAKELYVISDSNLDIGSNNYTIDQSSDYTAFAYAPTETGEYTISVSSGKIGIVSYTDMWVQNDPSEENVNASSVEWECTAVGQGIFVAVKATETSVTIQVKRKELIVEEEVPWVDYENKHTPQPFVLDGDFKEMEYVETFDDVVDEAVLGADGFYHLNSATGPVLYACLNDSVTLNLQDANSYGQLKEVLVDENGKIYSRTNFYDAFEAYFACADVNSGLYPLTEDLIAMFTRIGAYHGWYGEEGFVGGNLADAWMFACYYTEGETTITTTTGDPNTTVTTNTTSSTNGRPMPSAPTSEATTTATSSETTTTAVSGESTTTVLDNEATTTVSNGETSVTTSNGETDTTAPNGEANTTAPSDDANTTAPNGETDTTASNGETDATAPEAGNSTTVGADTGTTTVADDLGNTTAPVTDGTTSVEGSADTTVVPDNATTTINQVQNVGGNSAPTGDVSNAAMFVIVAVMAAAVVVLSSKKATAK